MSEFMQKATILKKTVQVGSSTLLSRFLGLAREIFLLRFLGAGAVADGFNMAFSIPSSLRKMFAEGAMTSAFVPTFITLFHKEGKQKADELMAFAFLFFETVVLLFCLLVIWKTRATINLIAPGFSEEQIQAAIPCLRILMPFIFFISSSSLLAGALQSVHHFFVPAISPVILNIVFIGGTLACLANGWDVTYLCYIILLGGLVQLIAHLVQYILLGFSFKMPTKATWTIFKQVLIKFLPCFFGMSVAEISFFMSLYFASYLPVGSVTLIKYTSRLMGIPLGVFATAFSTILLPHFARVHITDPKKLHFYLLESMKFVFWVTIPATIIMVYLSPEIFTTLFVSTSKKFPVELISEAGHLLMMFLCGLFFFSMNKILFSLYYAFHDTKYPTIIALIATGINFICDYYLISSLGTIGLALGMCIAHLVQTVLALIVLKYKHHFELGMRPFFEFAVRYLVQISALFIPLFALYKGVFSGVVRLCQDSPKAFFFFIESFGFWMWCGPLILLAFGLLYVTRKAFNVRVYFLD